MSERQRISIWAVLKASLRLASFLNFSLTPVWLTLAHTVSTVAQLSMMLPKLSLVEVNSCNSTMRLNTLGGVGVGRERLGRLCHHPKSLATASWPAQPITIPAKK